MWVKTIFWSLCYPLLRDGFNVHFMQKHRKWTARLPLSTRCFLIPQAGFFIRCNATVGFYRGIIILLKFHVSSRDFFPSKFRKISLFMKVLKIGIFGRFLTEYKIHYLYFYQIVLQLCCLTYLPKMNLFPWTVFLPEGFENGIIQRF